MSDCRRRHCSSDLTPRSEPSASCEALALLTCRRILLTRSGSRSAQMTWWSDVRTTLLLERQAPDARDKIQAALMQSGEARRPDGTLRVPFPASITVLRQP